MERIQQPLDQLLFDTSGNGPTSSQVSETLLAQALGLCMQQFADNWPHQPLESETVTLWLMQWRISVVKFGLDRFKKALFDLMGESDFMPPPAKINAELAKLKQIEDQEARAERSASAFRKCESCTCSCDSQSGLQQMKRPNGGTYAAKSACYEAWKSHRVQVTQ